MPMMLFRNRGFSNGCVASFVLMAGVFGLGFLTAQYLQLALHYNPLGVGLRLLPATGMALILAPIAGRLADRIGERPLVILGLGLEATGLLLIGALVNDTSGYPTPVGPPLYPRRPNRPPIPNRDDRCHAFRRPRSDRGRVRHQQHLPPGRRRVRRRDHH